MCVCNDSNNIYNIYIYNINNIYNLFTSNIQHTDIVITSLEFCEEIARSSLPIPRVFLQESCIRRLRASRNIMHYTLSFIIYTSYEHHCKGISRFRPIETGILWYTRDGEATYNTLGISSLIITLYKFFYLITRARAIHFCVTDYVESS